MIPAKNPPEEHFKKTNYKRVYVVTWISEQVADSPREAAIDAETQLSQWLPNRYLVTDYKGGIHEVNLHQKG